MPVKSDRWIIEMAQKHDLIKPFHAEQVRSGISFGVSSYGYDISLSDEFRVLKAGVSGEIDPKGNNDHLFADVRGDSVLVPPNSFVLGRSREYFRIPRDVVTLCFGKSTYARAGVIVNVTPFEPEWEGFATISVANSSPLPVRLYANQGIAQILFLEAADICATSYADKKGKYQAQKTITMSRSD